MQQAQRNRVVAWVIAVVAAMGLVGWGVRAIGDGLAQRESATTSAAQLLLEQRGDSLAREVAARDGRIAMQDSINALQAVAYQALRDSVTAATETFLGAHQKPKRGAKTRTPTPIPTDLEAGAQLAFTLDSVQLVLDTAIVRIAEEARLRIVAEARVQQERDRVAERDAQIATLQRWVVLGDEELALAERRIARLEAKPAWWRRAAGSVARNTERLVLVAGGVGLGLVAGAVR